MRRLRTEQTGGIYIEALVAIAVLSLALVPIIGAFAITPAAQRQAGRYVVAANLARGRLEALHGLSGALWESLSDTAETVTQEGQAYTVETDVEPPRAEGLRDVRVIIRWTDGKGASARLTLGTSVARRP